MPIEPGAPPTIGGMPTAPPPPPPAPVPPAPSGAGEVIREGLRTLRANPLTLVGFVLVVVISLLALAVWFESMVLGRFGWPWSLVPYNPNAFSGPSLAGVSWAHWFGTDELGRDMFSRVLFALPLDLGIALFITIAAVVIGGGLGLIAGFWDNSPGGRALSTVILRVTDVFLAFPTLVLALALAAVLGRNLNATLIALTATWWPYYVRLVRGEVLTIKHQGFIPAARIAGVSEGRILIRHVFRNLLEPLTVYATLDIGTVLVTFSTIAFVGIALPPLTPEWGSMVFYYEGRLPSSPWLVIDPGLAIFVSVLAFSLLGDGLREVLDPRTRRAFARVTQPLAAPSAASRDAPLSEG